jgi:hypothetical protein
VGPPLPGHEADGDGSLTTLRAIGYCAGLEAPEAALIAFQRHFRPGCCDGRLDLETTARLIEVRAAFDKSRAQSHVGGQNVV